MVKNPKTFTDKEIEKRLVGMERRLSSIEEKTRDEHYEIIRLSNKITGVDESLVRLRDDIISMKDEIMGELKVIREEQTILSSQHGRILDLEDKFEKLANIHPKFSHAQI